MAHGIPYVATATIAEARDLEAKVFKAMSLHGARYLHVLVPCPLGWGSAPRETIHLSRLAVQSGLYPLFEAENGVVTNVTKIRKRVPVETYLKPQKRFAHLFKHEEADERLNRLQSIADENIRRFNLLNEEPCS
jgi:pyruvate ferredoxin oxidoreductase beta subunit